MIRPRSIDILGVKYKIRHVDTGDKGGFWCPDNSLEISKDIKEKEEYLKTLIHECLHGVLSESGMAQDISISQEHCFIEPTINFLFKNFDIKLKKKR